MGLEQVQQPGKAAGREAVARLMPEPSSRRMVSARPCLASSSFATWSDFSRLTGHQATAADLQEDLVGDVVVRADEQPGEDLRKGARLAVNVDRLQALGHGPGRDLALDAAAGPLDERGDQLAGVLQATAGSWVRLMRPRPCGPRAGTG